MKYDSIPNRLNFIDQLFREDQVVSPAVLMKMAFIQESLGDYSEALYYLNEYFLLTSDEGAVQKMQQLSEQHSLRGYAYTDYHLIWQRISESIATSLFTCSLPC